MFSFRVPGMARYPTKRPIAANSGIETDDRAAMPAELVNVPWVDIHNHAHTLSWNDRERFALSGCEAMVMMAAGYYWTPYRPVAPEDVRYLWDDALNRLGAIRQSHFFDARLAIGVHTGTRVDGWEGLLDTMDAYCALDEVVAVGETGITDTQHAERWELDGQRRAVTRQLELAHQHDLPAVLHTPTDPDTLDFPFRSRGHLPRYEVDLAHVQPSVFDTDDVERAATEIDIECADDAGLADEKVILSHASPAMAPYVLESTDCYLSFTTSYPWLHDVTPRDIAAVISEYGPDRVLLETDSAGVLESDVFSFKRTLFELYRLGLDRETIRIVAYDNPMALMG